MLRQLEVDYGQFLFVDFGCGKGKALLLAAELHFQEIIGIELSSKLIRIAEDNLRTYIKRTRERETFRLHCMDAGNFQIPEKPAIYYFANPFQAEVMRKVLASIQHSHAAAPRAGYIAYLDPVLGDLLDEAGFLTPMKRTSSYSLWKVTNAPGPAHG